MCTSLEEKPWAAHTIKKKGGEGVKSPLDNCCLECWTFWDGHLKRLMTLQEFIAKMESKAVSSKDVSEGVALAASANGAVTKFVSSDVGTGVETSLRVWEQGLWLSEAQFEEYTNHQPKDCKQKAVVGINTKGETSKRYPVKDPAFPYPMFCIEAKSHDFKNSFTLQAGNQVLQDQSGWAWDFEKAARADGKKGFKGTFGVRLYSKEELQERAKENVGKQVASGSVVADEDGASEAAEDSDQEVVVRAGYTSPSKTTHHGGSEDGTTRFAESVFGDESGKKDGRTVSADHWISKLRIDAILSTKVKLGREEGFALASAERYDLKHS